MERYSLHASQILEPRSAISRRRPAANLEDPSRRQPIIRKENAALLEVLRNLKGLEPSPLSPQVIVLPLVLKGGLSHMCCWIPPASGHAGWTLADAVQ